MENNIYILLDKTNKKDTSGHYLWRMQCKICGQIILNRKNHKATACQHNFIKSFKINDEAKNERLYRIYVMMKQRCCNKTSKDYKYYGEKGIKICDDWYNNYYQFQKWALENGYNNNLTIDRIDSNKNYEPSNCRWVTRNHNSRFKSTTNCITINGVTKSGSQWSLYIGRGKNFINNHLKKNGLDKTIEYIESIGLV